MSQHQLAEVTFHLPNGSDSSPPEHSPSEQSCRRKSIKAFLDIRKLCCGSLSMEREPASLILTQSWLCSLLSLTGQPGSVRAREEGVGGGAAHRCGVWTQPSGGSTRSRSRLCGSRRCPRGYSGPVGAKTRSLVT